MQTLFLVCAVTGGTLLVIQLILLFVGADGSEGGADGLGDVGDAGDIAAHGDYTVSSGEGAATAAEASLTVISFKTLTAFLTFFGLGGLLGLGYQLGRAWTLGIAFAAGLLALYLVAYLWMLLNRLQSHGNVDLRNTVGAIGRVYLRIPGEASAPGKVTLEVQGRTLELNAITQGEAIPTGTAVRIVGLAGGETLRVQRLEEKKEPSNA
jgi:membrane protein implicated in regulation of membrane protease activity